MKRILWLLLLVLAAAPVFGQEQDLQLRLTRDFGSAFGSGNIRGTFSYRVTAPDDVVGITFLMDGEPVAEATEPPWRYQFNTADYPDGIHTLSAVGVTSNGRELTSNSLTRNFLPASTANRTTLILVGSILALVVGFTALSAWLSRRGLSGDAKAVSGAHGTAVCPSCGKPFARHLWAPNLVTGKFDRCPHCGKWNLVGRASQPEIEQALTLLRDEPAETSAPPNPADDLKKRLDDSRFDA